VLKNRNNRETMAKLGTTGSREHMWNNILGNRNRLDNLGAGNQEQVEHQADEKMGGQFYNRKQRNNRKTKDSKRGLKDA
jgi:hypothetical protein